MVNSYGKRFLDNAPEHTEDELMHLIVDSIFPCYRQLLSAELAMLYFRHQSKKVRVVRKGKPQKAKPQYKPVNTLEYLRCNKQAFKCLIASTKKIWTKE